MRYDIQQAYANHLPTEDFEIFLYDKKGEYVDCKTIKRDDIPQSVLESLFKKERRDFDEVWTVYDADGQLAGLYTTHEAAVKAVKKNKKYGAELGGSWSLNEDNF